MRGSTFRVLQTTVGIIVGFLMMPFLIGTLGKDLYGLWVVVGSVVGTYYLLDMGFSQAVTRFVTKYIHQQRYADANRIINTALVIYGVLGLLVFIVSCAFAFFGANHLVEDSEQVTLVQTILLIAGLQLAIEFPSKAFPGVVSAYMRFDWVAKVRTVKTVADALLIYYFVSNGYGLIAMACIGFVSGLASTAIYVVMVNKLFSHMEYGRQYVSISTLKGVYSFSKWVFVLDLNTMLRDKMDIWFIAFYLGPSVLTVYYVAIRLVDYAISFLTQATSMTGPIFTEYYAKEQWEPLRIALVRFIKLDAVLACIFIIGFILVGELFISLWMGDDFPAEDAWVCLIVLSLGRMSVYITSPLQSLLMTFNRHRVGAYISVCETAVIAVLCWLLIPLHGIFGAAISIAIPTLVGRIFVLPIYCQRIFKFLAWSWIVRLVGYTFISIAAASYLFLAFNGIMSGFYELVLWSIVVALFFGLFSLVVFEKDDLTEIRRIFSAS